MCDSMIDPGLAAASTRVARGHHADEVPAPSPLQHQRPATIALTAVFPPAPVARAQHLRVYHYIDTWNTVIITNEG